MEVCEDLVPSLDVPYPIKSDSQNPPGLRFWRIPGDARNVDRQVLTHLDLPAGGTDATVDVEAILGGSIKAILQDRLWNPDHIDGVLQGPGRVLKIEVRLKLG
jgi:hypothetical protein